MKMDDKIMSRIKSKIHSHEQSSGVPTRCFVTKKGQDTSGFSMAGKIVLFILFLVIIIMIIAWKNGWILGNLGSSIGSILRFGG